MCPQGTARYGVLTFALNLCRLTRKLSRNPDLSWTDHWYWQPRHENKVSVQSHLPMVPWIHARNQKFVFILFQRFVDAMLASPIWIVFPLWITILMLYLMKHRNARRRKPGERRCKLNRTNWSCHILFMDYSRSESSFIIIIHSTRQEFSQPSIWKLENKKKIQ